MADPMALLEQSLLNDQEVHKERAADSQQIEKASSSNEIVSREEIRFPERKQRHEKKHKKHKEHRRHKRHEKRDRTEGDNESKRRRLEEKTLVIDKNEVDPSIDPLQRMIARNEQILEGHSKKFTATVQSRFQ